APSPGASASSESPKKVVTAESASVMQTHSSTPQTKPTNGPKAVSMYAYGPPVIDTRLPASAKQRTISPIASVHTRYASGAAGPTAAATPAGSRKIPPPTVTFTIPAASPHVPITRASPRSPTRSEGTPASVTVVAVRSDGT